MNFQNDEQRALVRVIQQINHTKMIVVIPKSTQRIDFPMTFIMINRCSSIQAHLKLQLVDSLPFITHPIFAGRICTVAQVIIATKDNSPGAGFSSPRTKARAGFASRPTLTQASAAAGAGTGRRGVLMAHQARCPHRQAPELWKLFLGGHKAPLNCRSKNRLSLGRFKPASSPGLWRNFPGPSAWSS